MDKNEFARLMKSREGLYRLLGRIYFLEADEALITAMRGFAFPEECGGELGEGCALLKDYLRGAVSLDELAVDYARIFLSAGVAQRAAAFPYESVYTDRNHLVGQAASGEAAAIYAAKGLIPHEGSFKTPGDHIGLELDFMAELCAEIPPDIDAQRSFLNAHLLNWAPGFCQDAYKYAQTDFYRGIAKLTAGFLKLERELFSGEEDVWAIE